jgi:hypothetical protein
VFTRYDYLYSPKLQLSPVEVWKSCLFFCHEFNKGVGGGKKRFLTNIIYNFKFSGLEQKTVQSRLSSSSYQINVFE